MKLRSVILRRPPIEEIKQATSQDLSDQDLEVYEYLRPSQRLSANSAPNNLFYAEGNKVKIDRVDLQVSGNRGVAPVPVMPVLRVYRLQGRSSPTAQDAANPMWADTGPGPQHASPDASPCDNRCQARADHG